MRQTPLAALLTLSCLLISAPALAERADRDKPVNIEADRVTIDDRNKVHIFEGRVVLTQGTLVIRCDRMQVTQDLEGFQKGIATSGEGGLARFRQKREGLNEYIEGEAERIEYTSRNEAAQLFERAWIRSGQDEVRGSYIQYDGLTERYLVTNGPNASVRTASDSRVRAIIQPKSARTAP